MSTIYLVLILKKFLREKTLIKNFFKYKSGVNHYHFARKSPYRNDWLYIFAPLQKWLHVLAGPKQSPASQLKIQLIICYNFLRVWIYVRLPFFKLERSTTFFIGSWLIYDGTLAYVPQLETFSRAKMCRQKCKIVCK